MSTLSARFRRPRSPARSRSRTAPATARPRRSRRRSPPNEPSLPTTSQGALLGRPSVSGVRNQISVIRNRRRSAVRRDDLWFLITDFRLLISDLCHHCGKTIDVFPGRAEARNQANENLVGGGALLLGEALDRPRMIDRAG